MATLSHHSALSMFGPPPSGMGGPPPGQLYPYPPQPFHPQPAPRQRTAIACRYCRRRKIRCSGFDTSPDGRCANCMRFNQECVFTPVSSQTQAFVPAHALVNQRNTGAPVLYGPHGQPLPPGYPGNEYSHHPLGHDSNPPYRLPSPSSHDSYENDRNRGPTLPPPGQPNAPPFGRRSSAGDFPSHYQNQPPSPSSHLPPPHTVFTPPPTTSFAQGQASLPAVSGSYYQTLSPSANPPYERQRPESPGSSHRSSSEHPSVSPQPQALIHPPMVRPRSTGPSSPGGQIPSMQMSDLLNGPPNPSRPRPNQHAADGDMLSRLNSRTGL